MPKHPGDSAKTAIAIRHVAFEDLGNLEPVLRERGYRVGYRQAGVDRLGGAALRADLLVVLGGPIGAYEESGYPFLRDELALLEKRLAAGLPTLGICLGAQLMARALGANVYPARRKEIGWGRLDLAPAAREGALRHLDDARVLHWHGDTFDLPGGAVHLARTEICPNQAFSWGGSGLALQFHAEVCGPALERWYIGHACEIAASTTSVAELRADAACYAAALQPRAAKLWESWLSALS